jgi:hypothetical protein
VPATTTDDVITGDGIIAARIEDAGTLPATQTSIKSQLCSRARAHLDRVPSPERKQA